MSQTPQQNALAKEIARLYADVTLYYAEHDQGITDPHEVIASLFLSGVVSLDTLSGDELQHQAAAVLYSWTGAFADEQYVITGELLTADDLRSYQK